MCGIVGIVGSKDLAKELYRGLLHLQHRGQDASGILSYDEHHLEHVSGVNRIKQLGLVEKLFPELSEICGEVGIAQVRYPTIGEGKLQDAQPLYITSPNGIIGIAHNGNLVNYLSLRKELEREGTEAHTCSDVEIILNIMAKKYSEQRELLDNITESVREVYQRVNGAYSVLCCNKRLGGLIAFRDPKGIKPLLWGKRTIERKISYGFASEDEPLYALKFREIRPLEPGVVAIVDQNRELHFRELRRETHAHCAFEWVYFAGTEARLEDVGVYGARKRLGELLGQQLHERNITADVVVPVPDTARTAAQSLAQVLNIPFEEGLIKNRYIGRTFIMPHQESRENAVGVKLKPVREVLAGKEVIIVDDSIVRGTTSRKIIRLVKEAGAKKVYFASTYPPIAYPCYYGIDFQMGKELIANGKSIENVRTSIQADGLFFNAPADLKKAIGLEDICMACATGEYPTSVAGAEELEKLREKQTSAALSLVFGSAIQRNTYK